MNDKTQAERVAEIQKAHNAQQEIIEAIGVDFCKKNEPQLFQYQQHRSELLKMVEEANTESWHAWFLKAESRLEDEIKRADRNARVNADLVTRVEAAEATIKAIGGLPKVHVPHTDRNDGTWYVENDALQSILKGASNG